MENILKEINLKIKEIAQSEDIDTQRLTELINIRDRLKGYNTTSISQVQGFNQGVHQGYNNIPVTPVLGGMRQHQGNSVYDSLIDMANIHLKNSAKQIENKSVNDLIYYHKFISELEPSTDMITTTKRFEIKEKLENLILDEFTIQISKKNDKDKDKILDITLEGKI